MLRGGRRADAGGGDRVLRGGAALILGGLAGYAVARSPWAFVPASLAFLVGFGAFDVAVTARALAAEERTGRRVLAPAYAAFSGGAVLAALSSGLALGAGAGVPALLAVAGAVLLACTAAAGPADHGRGAPAGVGLRVLRAPRMAALAGLVALAFVVQGSLESWTTIYLRTELDQPATLGAAGIVAFHLAMLTGRVLGSAVGARAAPRVLLTGAGGLVAGGMALALATQALPAVVAGIALVGAASAVVVPTALSLAGAAAPGAAGAVAATLATCGYSAALVAPGGIGLAAEATSLRAALLLVPLAGLALAGLGAAATRVPRAARAAP